MGSVKVRVNSAGARAVLTSPGVLADVGRRGEAVASAACAMASSPDGHHGPPFASDARNGMNRARAVVSTATEHGRYANAKHDALLRALSAGRG